MPPSRPRRRSPRPLAALPALVLMAACTAAPDGTAPWLAWLAPDPAATALTATSRDAGRRMAPAVWAVLPAAGDGAAAPVAGSAVAIAPDRLLASCRALGDAREVALRRAGATRAARVTRLEPGGRLCALDARGPDLAVAPGHRTFLDLAPGEPVFAFASRGPADLTLAGGWLVAKQDQGDRFLETTIALPPEARSAVLFDARGNLVGIGSAGPTADSVVMAVPLARRQVRALADADGTVPATIQLAAATDAPRPRRWLLRFRESDGDGGRVARVEAVDAPGSDPEPGWTAADGPRSAEGRAAPSRSPADPTTDRDVAGRDPAGRPAADGIGRSDADRADAAPSSGARDRPPRDADRPDRFSPAAGLADRLADGLGRRSPEAGIADLADRLGESLGRDRGRRGRDDASRGRKDDRPGRSATNGRADRDRDRNGRGRGGRDGKADGDDRDGRGDRGRDGGRDRDRDD